MSVVTRWRSTFSSSVTHFTAMSGFLAVKSFVSPCILIMSLLFTVAIVSVVCAIEGAHTKRVAAPKRAPRTCFTVTSQFGVEHIPKPCNYVHTDLATCQGSDQAIATSGLLHGDAGANQLRTSRSRGENQAKMIKVDASATV